ncbi:hypothetical protein Tsubulata_040813, partial [Turnera subulata]
MTPVCNIPGRFLSIYDPTPTDPSYFSNLGTLCLFGARYCTELPALGQMECLKVLEIVRFDSIVTVGPEFYRNIDSSNNKKAFASLQKLEISGMPQLRQLMPPSMDDGEGQAFPLLQELHMEYCWELERILPQYLLPSLTMLKTTKLVDSIPRAASINVMQLGDDLRLDRSPSVLYNLKLRAISYILWTPF